MQNKIEPKTLPGFMELLPSKQIAFNKIVDKIRTIYERYGFLPLDTPIIEHAEVLLAKAGGETEKQIYRFEKGENDLALRFDLTVPLAKYVSMNHNELSFPFRRYQIGKVYRGEKPQKGRFREFYQCDIDIIGDEELNILHDAEMPSIIYSIFKELNFGEFTVHINNRKILSGFFEELGLTDKSQDILRTIDKIAKIGNEAVIEELEKLGINKEKIEKIMQFILIEGKNEEKIEKLTEFGIENEIFKKGIQELKQVIEGINLFEVPEKYIEIDLSIARGLDYYTGTVYETTLNEYPSLGSICSGGRYENLAEYYTQKKLPGVGISIGLTRLFYKLDEMNFIEQNSRTTSDVLLITADEKAEGLFKIATELRNAGINTEIYMNNKKLKAKFKYADRLQIPYVIVIGEEEIKTNTLTLKNMQTGEQLNINIEEAKEIILKNKNNQKKGFM